MATLDVPPEKHDLSHNQFDATALAIGQQIGSVGNRVSLAGDEIARLSQDRCCGRRRPLRLRQLDQITRVCLAAEPWIGVAPVICGRILSV